MGKSWSNTGSVNIKALHNNVFIAQFSDKGDEDLVLKNEPWHFNKQLVVLAEPVGSEDVTKISFKRVKVWVHLCNLPLICMNRGVAKEMAKMIGDVVEIPHEDKLCWGNFLRIKICIKVSKPLKRFLRVKTNTEGSHAVIILKYENIPNHCYVCGRLDHNLL